MAARLLGLWIRISPWTWLSVSCASFVLSVSQSSPYIHTMKAQRYNYILSLTSELEGGMWSMARPGRFIPGKDLVPIVQYRRLGGPRVTKLVLSLASLIPQSPAVQATQSCPLTSHSRTSCRILSITRILWCGGRPAAGKNCVTGLFVTLPSLLKDSL